MTTTASFAVPKAARRDWDECQEKQAHRRRTVGQQQIVAAPRSEQRHEVRQQAEEGLDCPGQGEKRHQRAESRRRFPPDSEQRPHRLRDEPRGRIADALHEVERCKENIGACYACERLSFVFGRP